jgi:hypothetical protein
MPPGAHPTDRPKVHDQNRPGRSAATAGCRQVAGAQTVLLQPQVVVLLGFADPLHTDAPRRPGCWPAAPARSPVRHTTPVLCPARRPTPPSPGRLRRRSPGPTSVGATASPSRTPHQAAAAAMSPRPVASPSRRRLIAAATGSTLPQPHGIGRRPAAGDIGRGWPAGCRAAACPRRPTWPDPTAAGPTGGAIRRRSR